MVRRRAKRTTFLSAAILELGTLLAIVALAQPSWTRQAIEQLPRLTSTLTPVSQPVPAPDVSGMAERTPGARSASPALPRAESRPATWPAPTVGTSATTTPTAAPAYGATAASIALVLPPPAPAAAPAAGMPRSLFQGLVRGGSMAQSTFDPYR